MSTDRRTLLALSGALVAGLAGCLDDRSSFPTGGSDVGGDHEVPEFPELDVRTDSALDEAAIARQVRGNVAFAFGLLGELAAGDPESNVFVSPYSVSVALAMTYAGARGDTAIEMAEALEFRLGDGDSSSSGDAQSIDGLDAEALHAAFGALEAEFDRRNQDGEEIDDPWDDGAGGDDTGDEDGSDEDEFGFQLTTANALWGQDGYGFTETFLDLLDAYYDAGMNEVDYASDPDAAREEINDWVEAETEGVIEDLLGEDAVSEGTRLVLTNAVYFLAPWHHDFDPNDTEPGTFTSLDGTEADVDLMYQSTELRYAEVDGHQLVELPYANEETSMVVILPAEGEFEAFEDALSVDLLGSMLAELHRPQVDLTLPKFGIESEFSLLEPLSNLGMPTDGDFGGIDGGGNLFIDDVIHQTFVEVDERGTEAAAATAVVMEESAPPDHVEMTVDRPFLFYIRDRPTETPLFLGRVVDGETLSE